MTSFSLKPGTLLRYKTSRPLDFWFPYEEKFKGEEEEEELLELFFVEQNEIIMFVEKIEEKQEWWFLFPSGKKAFHYVYKNETVDDFLIDFEICL